MRRASLLEVKEVSSDVLPAKLDDQLKEALDVPAHLLKRTPQDQIPPNKSEREEEARRKARLVGEGGVRNTPLPMIRETGKSMRTLRLGKVIGTPKN